MTRSQPGPDDAPIDVRYSVVIATPQDALPPPPPPRQDLGERLAGLGHLLVETGLPATIAAAAGGAGFGMLLVDRLPATSIGIVLDVVAMVAGSAATLALWLGLGIVCAAKFHLELLPLLRRTSLIAGSGLAYPVSLAVLGPRGDVAGVTITLLAAFLALMVESARHSLELRDVLLVFGLTRLPIIAIAQIAGSIIGERHGTPQLAGIPSGLAVWARWDALHYLTIAQRGYAGTDPAFFPLYPILIRLVTFVTHNGVIAGLLISNLCYLAGLVFLRRLVLFDFDRDVAQRAMFYISIFPSSVFFSAVYTESLFFMLTVAAFLAMRSERWLVAGIVGGIAASTRVSGILLLIPYTLEFFAARSLRYAVVASEARAIVRRFVVGGVLGAGGLVFYMIFLILLRGDPLYFTHVQSHWHRSIAAPWESISRSIHMMATSHQGATIAVQSIEFTFTAVALAIIAAGWKTVRVSYVAFAVASMLLPLSTSSLMSTPRFELVIFPIFIVLAVWGARSVTNIAIISICMPLLGLFTVLFADSYWIA